jgi:hypothetical protein
MLKNYNYERQQGQEIEFVELLEHDFLSPIVSFGLRLSVYLIGGN